MYIFFGRLFKYLLWISLFVFILVFSFGLFKFKGNIVGYIGYLNSIDVRQIIFRGNADNTSLDEMIFDKNELDDVSLSQNSSGGFDDDYFLPEASEFVGADDSDGVFGFSGVLEKTDSLESDKSENLSISKKALIDLVTREK